MKKYIVAGVFISILLMLTGCSSDNLSAVDPSNAEEILFEVPSGSTVTSVAKNLEDLKIINNDKAFKNYAIDNNMTNIKAGEYMLSKSMSSIEIIEKIYNGDNYKGIRIVVPEGFEAVQIASRIQENGLGAKEEFIALVNSPQKFASKYEFLQEDGVISLEGYLFPKTYHFKPETTMEEIVEAMLDQFSIVYENTIKSNYKKTGLTVNEVINLASVIEREAAIVEEMPLVSSVFYNRLSINMPLQSCATVQYILGERKAILSNAEIKIDSPYNTYIYKGLPKTPIASPGIAAIEAALNPAETDYVFFLSKNDGSGEQVYAVTYEEHLVNKNKYLSN